MPPSELMRFLSIPCDAGRRLLHDADVGGLNWAIPCPDLADIPLHLTDAEETYYLCSAHIAVIESTGITHRQ